MIKGVIITVRDAEARLLFAGHAALEERFAKMKRLISITLGLCLAGLALAQAPFTIVRPADGSKVREKVRVQIPKNSVPEGGYIGFFVGGKFVEALVPTLKGNYYEYILDTKGRGIPDGNLKIEAVLYMEGENAAPRILDRSSVNVSVQNSASIKVPAQGYALRYKFTPGTEYVYKHISRVSMATITDAQRQLGGRAAELPLDYDVVRLLFAVDNAYGNGEGLVRVQAIPPKGQDHLYANATVSGGTEGTKLWTLNELAPIYMRLTSTGHEVFGSIPDYYGFEGAGSGGEKNLYVAVTLPTLPTKRVKPGDSWQSRFQVPRNVDLSKLHLATSVVDRLPARGEFVGVEWEMGHPCAKIRNVIEAGNRKFNFGGAAATQGGEEKISLTETTWFALDKQMVLKSVTDYTVDRKVEGGAGNGINDFMGGGARNTGGGNNTGNIRPPGGGGDDDLRSMQKGPGGLPGLSSGQGGAQGRGNPGAAGGGNRGGGGGTQWVRIRAQVILVLEQ
jgi:hypothetical protein